MNHEMSHDKLAYSAFLKALGRRPFPRELLLPGGRYGLVRLFKHDFFAATGLFRRSDGHTVVLKIGRTADLLGLPGRWIGRFLARREARIYRALADVECVPAWVAMWEDCGFVHEFAPGHALQFGEDVGDDFFDQLESLIGTIHSRGMAYVDLEKCENIIVGEDGRPYLIDFQISWYPRSVRVRRSPLVAWFTRLLQGMDEYHLLKHRRKMRPDQLDAAQLAQAYKLPGYLQVHRAVVGPLQKIRRAVLRRVDPEYAATRR